MNSETTSFVIALGIVALAAIISITLYSINDRNLMAQNINSAIEKGINPLSVRCSYAESTDTVCVAYAASKNQ